LLDALEIEWMRVEAPSDIGRIREATRRAAEIARPVAVLIGAHTSWA
jgi:sulfopyruvate decarboxylase TPP-binding subunit